MPRKPVLDWIDTNKAAEIMGTTPQWVRELIQRHKFPNVTQVGKVYLIPKSDLESYLRERNMKREKIKIARAKKSSKKRLKSPIHNREYVTAVKEKRGGAQSMATETIMTKPPQEWNAKDAAAAFAELDKLMQESRNNSAQCRQIAEAIRDGCGDGSEAERLRKLIADDEAQGGKRRALLSAIAEYLDLA